MNTISMVYLNQAEKVQYLNGVYRIVNSYDCDTMMISSKVDNYHTAVKKVNDNYRPDNETFTTEQVVKLDDILDESIECVYAIAKGYQKHYLPEVKLAARKIVACFDKYGKHISRQAYNTEINSVENICKDLSTNLELSEAIIRLNITNEVAHMAQSNSKFAALYFERNKTQSEHSPEKFAEILEDGVVAYKTIMKFIDAATIFYPDINFQPMINEVNTFTHNTEIANHRRRAERKEEKQETANNSNEEASNE